MVNLPCGAAQARVPLFVVAVFAEPLALFL
jgi:hypothetical protein